MLLKILSKKTHKNFQDVYVGIVIIWKEISCFKLLLKKYYWWKSQWRFILVLLGLKLTSYYLRTVKSATVIIVQVCHKSRRVLRGELKWCAYKHTNGLADSSYRVAAFTKLKNSVLFWRVRVFVIHNKLTKLNLNILKTKVVGTISYFTINIYLM